MTAFVERVVEDLRGFAKEVLDQGLSAPLPLDLEHVRAPSMTALLAAARTISAEVPGLVMELTPTAGHAARRPSSAVGRRLSNRAADYLYSGSKGPVPKRWAPPPRASAADPAALAFLSHVIDVQRDLLRSVAERTRKQIDEARVAKRGTSTWALSDAAYLDSLEAALLLAENRLDRAARHIRDSTGGRVRSSRRLPRPFPDTRAWRRLRSQARDLSEPARSLPAQLRSMLGGEPESADVPYLYQRWCGVKLLEAFVRLGWEIATDPVGPLLLGGRILLRRGEERIRIWVEARLTGDGNHPSGFRCRAGREATPDFLIIAKGPSRYDAFVLDATMTASREVILEKGKYLDLLFTSKPGYAAGLPVPYQPRRSWAAAPLPGRASRLFDASGKWGALPMNPVRWRAGPLDAWVLDIDRYARAWASVEDDPRFVPLSD